MQLVGLFIEALFFIAVWPFLILQPILREVKTRPAPRTRARFSTTDLLTLMFLVQLPIAGLLFTDARISDAPAALMLIFSISFVVWLAGLQAANHLGIENQWKRILAIGLLFPVAITSGIPLAIFTSWVFDRYDVATGGFCLVAIAILSWFIRRAAQWVSVPAH